MNPDTTKNAGLGMQERLDEKDICLFLFVYHTFQSKSYSAQEFPRIVTSFITCFQSMCTLIVFALGLIKVVSPFFICRKKRLDLEKSWIHTMPVSTLGLEFFQWSLDQCC